MKWFYNLKIRTKLLSAFILISLLIGVVGAIGIANIKALESADKELYENMTVPISQAGQISTAFQTLRVNLRDMIIANDPQTIQANADKITEQRAKMDTLATEFEKTIQTEEMRSAYNAFFETRKEYAKHLDILTALAIQNQDAEAFALMSPDGAAGKATIAEQEAINKLVDLKLTEGQEKAAANAAQGSSVVTTMLIIILVGILISIILGLLLSANICLPLRKASHMIQDMSKGHFKNRLKNDSTDEIGQMSKAMDDFSDILQYIVIGTMNRISEGDLSINIDVKDPEDELAPAMKKTIETIRDLIAEANALSQAAVEGRLDTRGHVDAFKGGYRDILTGVNNTLDAVVGPLNIAAEYIERIGKGEIPPKITDEYYGDFREIKNNLNGCIDGLGALAEANQVLAMMNKNDLSQPIAGNYEGIYGEIAVSINGVHAQMLRIVNIVGHIGQGDLTDLAFLKGTGQRSDNDRLIPSLIEMIENILMLVDETKTMAQVAIDGDLNNRGDAGKFKGEYTTVIEGFNLTLDAIIDPIKAASSTLKELAQGKLNITMQGDFKGHHGKIKEDMNQTIAFLNRYVGEITETLKYISDGNLNQEIATDYLGDFLPIKTALNQITSNLSTTLSDINVAAGQVEIGARQISDGGQALSQGTTEQASSIQELTASIAEVSAETKRNALNANEANDRAIEVRRNAEVGNNQMDKMVAAMVEINDSSSNISKIIKVIDDIAFQTNILALNAAVEAARAGQHGKGFAVVAEEVRTLAARSAEAVKETTGLIEGSIDKVKIGTSIADETAESLKEILSEIEKVAGLVGDIAHASNGQASEIAQITQGIEQVSTVVQTNSATAEESAAASEELSGQAELLKHMVDRFKLKEISGKGPRATAPVSKPMKQPIALPPEPLIILDYMDDKY